MYIKMKWSTISKIIFEWSPQFLVGFVAFSVYLQTQNNLPSRFSYLALLN